MTDRELAPYYVRRLIPGCAPGAARRPLEFPPGEPPPMTDANPRPAAPERTSEPASATEAQIWRMLDAWYQLIGRRAAPSAAERAQDYAAMSNALRAFEIERGPAPAPTGAAADPRNFPRRLHGADGKVLNAKED